MKKYIVCIVLILMIGSNCCYGLSNNFREVISVMGIERYNNQGYEINEYIYYTYNQIVYGTPEDAINEPTQRWKNTQDGKWVRNGKNGEYRLLGYNNIGKVVNNHDFPMDIVPSTQPTEWNYIELPDALESWNDISRYKFIEQRDYMKNVNLMRNNITYDINANEIGLEKARLDNCSTWKTKGLIYTNRQDAYGKKWEATFVAPEIGHDIEFNNYVSAKNNLYFPLYVHYDNLTINYSASVTGKNSSNDLKYIKPEHVKKLETSIYINGYLLGTITSTKTLSHSGSKTFEIYHQDLLGSSTNAIIDIRSKLYTEFTTDGPLYASNSCKVYAVTEQYLPSNIVSRERLNENEYRDPNFNIPKEDSKVDLENNNDVNIDVVKIVKKNSDKYVQELNKSNTSNGFVNAGSVIGIKVKTSPNTFLVKMNINGDESIRTFDIKTQQFEWEEPTELGNATMYTSLEEYVNIYNSNEYVLENVKEGIYYFEYLIPYETKQTLHSWNSIRDVYGSSFNVNKNILLSRIRQPYTLEFEIYEQVEEETEKRCEYIYECN